MNEIAFGALLGFVVSQLDRLLRFRFDRTGDNRAALMHLLCLYEEIRMQASLLPMLRDENRESQKLEAARARLGELRSEIAGDLTSRLVRAAEVTARFDPVRAASIRRLADATSAAKAADYEKAASEQPEAYLLMFDAWEKMMSDLADVWREHCVKVAFAISVSQWLGVLVHLKEVDARISRPARNSEDEA